ncbi:negative regulation of bile acid biosynthetic process [Branchiostoma belcheri]|nr:negative regulation of bile acid biosynthetic process [Branchiostoma belcheri]
MRITSEDAIPDIVTEGHVAVVESDLDSVLRIYPLRIVDNAVVSVHYYMHSNSIKPPYPFLNVSVLCDPEPPDGKPETLTSYEGSSWRRWAEARLYLSPDSGCKVFTVLIKGRRGDGTLAIDDVELRTDDPAPSRLLATSSATGDVTSYTVEPLTEPRNGNIVASCFFNNSDHPFCGWENPHHGNLVWTPRKGQTPTPNTGPMEARPDGDLYYVHIEATTVMNEEHDNFTASLYTPEITTQSNAAYMCAKFYYHMYGKDIGTFSVYIQYGMDTLTRRLLYELGEKDQHWYRASVTFAATFQPFRLLFEATAYPGRQLGDIALDDVVIMTGRCPKETEPTEAPTSGGAQNHFLQPTRTETIIIAAILGGIVVVLLVAVIALGAPLLIKSFKRSRCYRRRRGGRQQGNTPMARTQSQSPFSRDELWGTYFSRRFRNRPPSYRTYQRQVAAEQQLRRINAATLAPPTEGEPPPAYDDVFNSAYNQLDDPPEAEVMTSTLEPVPEEGITPDNPVENEGEENNQNSDETLDKLEERLQKKPKRRRAVDKDTFTVDIEATNDEEEIEEDDQNDSSVQSNTEDTEDTLADVENEDTESQVNQTEVQIQTEPVIEESRNTSGENCQSPDDVRIVIRLPTIHPQPADDSDGGITNAAFEGDNEEEPTYEEIQVPEEARSC